MTEPDRHVTRTGDDYAVSLAALIPQGQAWPRAWDGTLMRVIRGLCRIWGDFEVRASKLLEMESDPRLTIELLPDWERNWGLPDPCYTEPQSIAERQLALVMRMTLEGSQSRQFFIDISAMIGYTITITEYRPFFIAMDGCGDCRQYGALPPDPMRNQWGQEIMGARGDARVEQGELSEWPCYGLGPLTNRYYWTVHVDRGKLTWFRVASGQTGVDPHLRIGIADDLECLLNRWKPAHSDIIFDYSGMQDPPQVIFVGNLTMPENLPVGTVLGTFDIINNYTGSPVYYLMDDAEGLVKCVGNQLQVAKIIDFEKVTSLTFTVMAGDMSPIPGTSSFTITVTDVDDPPPIITSSNTASVAENATFAFSLTAGTPVTWMVDGGYDGGQFEILGSTLHWTGNGTRNFEAPADADRNNVYEVVVRATDVVENFSTQQINVTVTDVLEPRYAVWDVATVAGVTLSGSGTVATNTGTTGTTQGAHGDATKDGKTSGKHYFEVTWTTITGGDNSAVGIGTPVSTYPNMGVGGTVGVIARKGGTVYASTVAQVTFPAWAKDMTTGIAVDLTARKIWFRHAPTGNWNNSPTANPVTNTGGFNIPAGTMVPFVTFGSTNGKAGNVFTANFGTKQFIGALPTGFASGWFTMV